MGTRLDDLSLTGQVPTLLPELRPFILNLRVDLSCLLNDGVSLRREGLGERGFGLELWHGEVFAPGFALSAATKDARIERFGAMIGP